MLRTKDHTVGDEAAIRETINTEAGGEDGSSAAEVMVVFPVVVEAFRAAVIRAVEAFRAVAVIRAAVIRAAVIRAAVIRAAGGLLAADHGKNE